VNANPDVNSSLQSIVRKGQRIDYVWRSLSSYDILVKKGACKIDSTHLKNIEVNFHFMSN